MAVNDRFELTVQGEQCGAQIALNFSYIQIQPNIPGENPGLTLAKGWLNAAQGPWQHIQPLLSSMLKLVCINWRTLENVGSAAVMGGAGTGGDSINKALPPTAAILFHEWAQAPHREKFAGRFYLPGLTVALVDGPGLVASLEAILLAFGPKLINIPEVASGTVTFRMIPNKAFQPNIVVPTGATVYVGRVFADPLVRRVLSRTPDHCNVVAAQGAPISMPEIEVTEP